MSKEEKRRERYTVTTLGTKKRGLKAEITTFAQYALGDQYRGSRLLATFIYGKYPQGAITEIDGHQQRVIGIFLTGV